MNITTYEMRTIPQQILENMFIWKQSWPTTFHFSPKYVRNDKKQPTNEWIN